MNRIDRYIIAHVLLFIALVAFALVAVYSFVGFLSDMGDVGRGQFGVLQLMLYTLMQMPSGLYTLLPIIAMLGTLMGLGVLASQSELTAMRASGVSLLRIGIAVQVAGLALGVFGYVLGDWIAPASDRAALDYKIRVRDGVVPQRGGLQSVWLRDGSNIFHIQQLLTQDHISGVDIFTLAPDMSLSAVYRAQDGRYADDHWTFTQVSKTALTAESAQAETLPTLDWPASLSPEVLHLMLLEAQSLTMPGLLRLIGYLEDNHLDAVNYRIEMWRKLVAPVTVMSLMLFAIPFVLGSPRSGGAGQRLLIGVLIGVGFYVMTEISVNLGQVYQWTPFLSAATPTLLLLAAGLIRLSRAR
jgi:lipopolysaccharide export system permease protein